MRVETNTINTDPDYVENDVCACMIGYEFIAGPTNEGSNYCSFNAQCRDEKPLLKHGEECVD